MRIVALNGLANAQRRTQVGIYRTSFRTFLMIWWNDFMAALPLRTSCTQQSLYEALGNTSDLQLVSKMTE